MSQPTHRDWFGLDGFQPGPEFTGLDAACYLLDEVGSTSDFLLGRGEPANGRLCRWREWGWQAETVTRHVPLRQSVAGTLAVARRQTGGRGRQGRRWFDCGGLFLSWVWNVDPAVLHTGLAVWVGLITAEALAEYYELDIRLKWPNDLLVAGRKLGGVLLDRVGPGPFSCVVAGLGVNIGATRTDFPPELMGRATSLCELLNRKPQVAEVAGIVLTRLGAELNQFKTAGWAPYRRSYARRDWLAGRHVTWSAEQRKVRGYVAGIDADGSLLLVTANGVSHSLQVGEVHLSDPRVSNLRVETNSNNGAAGHGSADG